MYEAGLFVPGSEGMGTDDGHAASDVSQTLLRQADQTAGDAGLLHDVAGEDEEGDGQQDEFAAGGGAKPGQDAHDGVDGLAAALDQDGGHAGHAQAGCDGGSEGQQDHEDQQ